VNLTTDEQKLIANDNIYIPILNGSSISKSAIRVESLAIKPYEYLDTLGNISNVSVTLDTDYRELWEDTLLSSSVVENLSFLGTVEFGSDKIYINSSALPYLKLPNQTASVPLHAGMISCTVENPDGGSDLWHPGGGSGHLAHGTLWEDIPSSDNITQFDLTNLIVDESLMNAKLNFDHIIIQVTDYEGDWWRAQVNFDWNFEQPKTVHPKITTITVQARGMAEDTMTLNSVFDTSTTINFLDCSESAFPNSCYQNADIDDSNTLHVEISEVAPPGQERGLALKYFALLIA